MLTKILPTNTGAKLSQNQLDIRPLQQEPRRSASWVVYSAQTRSQVEFVPKQWSRTVRTPKQNVTLLRSHLIKVEKLADTCVPICSLQCAPAPGSGTVECSIFNSYVGKIVQLYSNAKGFTNANRKLPASHTIGLHTYSHPILLGTASI